MRLFLLLFVSISAFAVEAEDLVGVWHTADQEAKVQIERCGQKFCGKIIYLKEAIYAADDDQGMAGKPKVDRENPDKKLRDRQVVGLEILSGFRFKDGKWSGGTIYDPESGKTYKCKITLRNDGKLEVRGFIGFSLLGRTEIWTKAQ